MELEPLYQTYKPLLLSVAYRMVGTLSDAEDLVHDVFLTLQHAETDRIRHTQAYLVKMITNRCLNFLTLARKRREQYMGPWLPEPQVHPVEQDPAAELIQKEMVAYALLVLMEQLSPLERAVFILRKTLGYAYPEISEVLGKTEANCRKLYSRAKNKLPKAEPLFSADPAQTEPLVQAFIKAANTGQFGGFIELLTEQAVLLSDGGGKVRAAIRPIMGRARIRAFLEGIAKKGSLEGTLLPVAINGQAGLLFIKNGHVAMALCFAQDTAQKRATHIYIVSNPDKLRHIAER